MRKLDELRSGVFVHLGLFDAHLVRSDQEVLTWLRLELEFQTPVEVQGKRERSEAEPVLLDGEVGTGTVARAHPGVRVDAAEDVEVDVEVVFAHFKLNSLCLLVLVSHNSGALLRELFPRSLGNVDGGETDANGGEHDGKEERAVDDHAAAVSHPPDRERETTKTSDEDTEHDEAVKHVLAHFVDTNPLYILFHVLESDVVFKLEGEEDNATRREKREQGQQSDDASGRS